MWGKPVDASVENTNDWFAIPLSSAYERPTGLIGPFTSQSDAWDWLEDYVRNRKQADGGLVYQAQATKPMEKITPGVLLSDGRTYYPTGLEWLLVFSMAGCQWAIDALERYEADQGERWAGDGI